MKTPAKKRFGQHFLRDTGVLARITRLIQPMPGDVIIDIGAGDGALSTRLAPLVSELLAIEVDTDCLPALESSLAPFPCARVVAGDILALNLEQLVCDCPRPGRRLRAAGNLPYNIATAVILRLLQSNLPISDMVFMVQLEVAERITAPPASRQFGLLSVLCQHRAHVQIAFKVSPACFVPRPKVMSAVITLNRLPSVAASEFEGCFVELAKAAFSYRRKTLSNSLRRHPVFGAGTATLLGEAGIDGSRRPEDLSVAEYEHLALTQIRRMRTLGVAWSPVDARPLG